MVETAQNAGLTVDVGITLNKLTQQLARAEARMVNTAKKSERAFANSNRRVVRSFQQTNQASKSFASGGLRNVSLQLSQVAQQASAGGDAMRALAIQLPDLAIGFGTLGIALGAVAGLVAPIFVDMIRGADDAKELEEAVKSLSSAMKDLRSAGEDMGRPLEELLETFGAFAAGAQELSEVERQIAQISSRQELNKIQDLLADTFTIGDKIANSTAQELEDLAAGIRVAERAIARLNEQGEALVNAGPGEDQTRRQWLDQIAGLEEQKQAFLDFRQRNSELIDQLRLLGDEFLLTADQAAPLAAAINAINAADSPQSFADAMVQLAAVLPEIQAGSEEPKEEFKELRDLILESTGLALEFAAVDMATPIAAAANVAASLAEQLGLAAETARGLMGTGAVGSDAARNSVTDTYSGIAGLRRDQVDRFTVTPPRSAASTAGGGARGVDPAEQELNRLLRERDRILRSIETASEAYARQLADLNRLQELGHLTTEQYSRAMANLDEDLRNAEFGNIRSEIESIASALATAIVEGENLGEALGNVFKRIAADLIASGLTSLMMQAFGPMFGGGGLGGGGGFLGGLFGGIPGRASGGPVSAGQPYQVGERGPELFVPATNGRIMTAADTRQMMGGGGSARVELIVQTDSAQIVRIARGEADLRVQQSEATFQAALPDQIQNFSVDARLR